MGTPFSIKQILDSPVGHLNQHLLQPAKKSKPVEKVSAEKTWLHNELTKWCTEKGYELKTEYRFTEERRWRFDWFLPALKTGIEYEGIFSKKSRHTNNIGYSKDTEKYSQAAILGYKVLRYTAINYFNVIDDLTKI